MKNYQNKSTFLILFGLFLSISNIHSQTNSNDISIYNWFDNTVGNRNLDIINGTPHINPFNTIGENNLYFINQYEIGNLKYDGEDYYNVKLKYDIYRDLLVLNPFGESENIGINLIQKNVEAFSIKDSKFVKIEKTDKDVPGFTSGYYEESKIGSNFIFYIKHHKDIRKIVKEAGSYYSFTENTMFFIDFNNKIDQINSKNDIIKLFPDQKKNINEFYLMNRELKKYDLNQFMKNLMKYIYSSASTKN